MTTIDYAALAGMSDDAIKAKTGCTWERWVYALDKKDASTWSHRAIADYVKKTYKVPDWWTQTVTVGYERIKGKRAIVDLTVRTARRDKSLRITWPDGSRVEALFYGKGAGKSQLAITHGQLKAQAASTEMKAFWADRLSALGEVVAR